MARRMGLGRSYNWFLLFFFQLQCIFNHYNPSLELRERQQLLTTTSLMLSYYLQIKCKNAAEKIILEDSRSNIDL